MLKTQCKINFNIKKNICGALVDLHLSSCFVYWICLKYDLD